MKDYLIRIFYGLLFAWSSGTIFMLAVDYRVKWFDLIGFVGALYVLKFSWRKLRDGDDGRPEKVVQSR